MQKLISSTATSIAVEPSTWILTTIKDDSLESNQPPGYIRTVTINSNRLASSPVYGEDGAPVDVRTDDSDWILLVPSVYRGREGYIREYFDRARNGSANYEGARQARSRYYSTDLAGPQKVKIFWSADGQSFETGNPLVSPERNHVIDDPIIQVIAKRNSHAFDRFNAVAGTLGAALRVPVVNDIGPEKTLAEMRPVLKELHLDDNLLNLSVLEYAKWRQS